MSLTPLQLTPELIRYYRNDCIRDTPILQELRKKTAELPMAVMQIAAEQGQFMAFLVQCLQAKKTLDIGVFTGYSALVVAQALPEDGQVIALDLNDEWTSIAKHFWEKAGVSQKISLRLAPAQESLAQLIENGESGTFDFAFIDADKACYDTYYEQCLTLCRPGGVIALDNTLQEGQVANPTIHTERIDFFRQLNKKIRDDERVTCCLLPITDGLTLAMKR